MTRVSEHVGLQHAGGPRDRARLGRESGAAASVWLVRIVAWSAFVAICDFRGRIVFRAMRGSVFARAARTAG